MLWERRTALIVTVSLPLAVLPVLMSPHPVAACTHQVSLTALPDQVQPGGGEAVTGGCFSTDPTVPPIEVRLDSSAGRLLWTGRPDEAGSFSFPFTAPDAVGYHVVLAFQSDPYGYPMPGTPGRAPFQVVAPAPATSAAQPVVQSPPAAPMSSAPSAGVPATVPVTGSQKRAKAPQAARPAAASAAEPARAPVAVPAGVPAAAPVAVPGNPLPPVAAEPGQEGGTSPATVPAAPPISRPQPASPSGGRFVVVAIVAATAAVMILAAGLLWLRARRSRRRPAPLSVPLVTWAEDVVARAAGAVGDGDAVPRHAHPEGVETPLGSATPAPRDAR